MPAEDCPSFHCRPSTVNTLRPLSLSIRQMPTMGMSDVGSAPTVLPDRSIATGWPAARVNVGTARPMITAAIAVVGLKLVIGRLLAKNKSTLRRPTAEPPWGELLAVALGKRR